MTVTIRSYRPGDEEQIVPLLREAFPSEKPLYDDMKFWNWIYRDNPTKLRKIWVAEEDGKIVGHFAFSPGLMKIDGQTRVGMFTINSAVHPDHQGKGIYSALVKQVNMETHDIPVVYGYPNKLNLAILSKQYWVAIPAMPILVKPLNMEGCLRWVVRHRYPARMLNAVAMPLVKLFTGERKFDLPGGVSIKRVPSFDDRFDVLWNNSGRKGIITVRDRKYLTWRYVDKPDSSYIIYIAEKEQEIAGYIILALREYMSLKTGMIVDVLTLPGQPAIALALIAAAIKYFIEEQADTAICSIHDGIYYRALREMGFWPVPYKSHRLAIRVMPEIDDEFLHDIGNYFLTDGDRPHAA
jgi:GNAT superfamily N-acetyltransferase